MSQKSPSCQLSCPCSALSVILSTSDEDAEVMPESPGPSEDSFRRGSRIRAPESRVQQSADSHMCSSSLRVPEAEKRETHTLGLPRTAFCPHCEKSTIRALKVSRLNFVPPFAHRPGLNSDVAEFQDLWAELGISAEEQRTVSAYLKIMPEQARSTLEARAYYRDTLERLAECRRMHMPVSLLYERLTVDIRKRLQDTSCDTDDLLVLLALYRYLLLGLLAINKTVGSLCGTPVSLPYLNVREAKCTSLINRVLGARVLTSKAVETLVHACGSTDVDSTASFEEFLDAFDAVHGSGAGSLALLLACPCDMLDSANCPNLHPGIKKYMTTIDKVCRTRQCDISTLLDSWAKRMGLDLSFDTLLHLTGLFPIESYFPMVSGESQLLTELEVQLEDMLVRDPDHVPLTVRIVQPTELELYEIDNVCSCKWNDITEDSPNSPLLSCSSVSLRI